MCILALNKKDPEGFRNLQGLTKLSGRRDSNPGPLAPKASALAGLRYAPNSAAIIAERPWFDKHFLSPSRNGMAGLERKSRGVKSLV